jgi:hypothetical protein
MQFQDDSSGWVKQTQLTLHGNEGDKNPGSGIISATDMYYLIVCFLALAVVGVLVYVVRRITSRNRYTDMTDQEFEAEAKRTSPVFGLMLAIQKLIDPSHHVEYIQRRQDNLEAGESDSGDRGEPHQLC